MIRYAILYFIMLVVFVLLIAGPLIASPYIGTFEIPLKLMQPTGLSNNDTHSTETGTAVSGARETGTTDREDRGNRGNRNNRDRDREERLLRYHF